MLSESEQVILPMLVVLYRERNARMPINRLPVEVLAQIFGVFAIDGGLLAPFIYLDLLRISHTSSYWRSITLAHPKLWTSINLTTMPMKIAWLFLERSATCPITVGYFNRCAYLEMFCRMYMQRARAVNMHLDNQLYLILYLPYEELEELSITATSGHGINFHGFAMPRLRCLKAYGTLLSVPTALRSLTDLTVTIVAGEASNIVFIADIFRQAAHLQQVFLNKSLDSDFHALGRYNRDPIYMKSVRFLHSRTGPNDCRWLLSAIVLPESATVLFTHPEDMNLKPSFIASCFPVDSYHLPRLFHFTDIHLDVIKFDGSTSSTWMIKFRSSKDSPKGDIAGGSVVIDLGNPSRKDSIDIFKAVVSEPIRRNSDKVHNIYFNKLKYFTSPQRMDMLTVLLSSLPDIRTFLFWGCTRPWLTSVKTALVSKGTTGPLVLQFSYMTICTTEVLALYVSNESLAKTGDLILHGCKLQSDRDSSWKKDLEDIHTLGVHVKLSKDSAGTVSTSVSP